MGLPLRQSARIGGSLRRSRALVLPIRRMPQLREWLDRRRTRLRARAVGPASRRQCDHLLLNAKNRRRARPLVGAATKSLQMAGGPGGDCVARTRLGCRRMSGGPNGEVHAPPWSPSALPFKYHAGLRHHIPKPRYRVTNWAEYDASLGRRGSFTLWFTGEAIQAWRAEPRTTPGGQPHYSPLAITTALTMRMVFGLALRQTEGLIGSVIGLLGLDL